MPTTSHAQLERFITQAFVRLGMPDADAATMGRLMADAECTAHEIMAALGHTTLGEAERYTREADRRRGGRSAISKLEDRKKNNLPQTALGHLGIVAKSERKST